MAKLAGNYSNITRVRKFPELLLTSVQVGAVMNGNVPKSLNNQINNSFANMKKVIESEGGISIEGY